MYKYKHIKSQVEILIGTLKDAPEILRISNSLFGKMYLTSKQLGPYLRESISHKRCYVVKSQNKVVGFSLLVIINKQDLPDHLFLNLEVLNALFIDSHKIGWRKMTGILPSCQNKGYATKLAHVSYQFWIRKNIDTLISVCWQKDKVTPAEKMLIKDGFCKIITVKEYWQFNSLKERYSCQICGQPPCICYAGIYKKMLN